MAGAGFDGVERERLCELMDHLGPGAPTLLEPWTTFDLAAHLYLREHDALAAPGLVLGGPWERVAERHRVAAKQRGYGELLATIRSGPPAGFFSLGWVRRFPNLNEFFVHHEDVRRANGHGPRSHRPAEDAALFRNAARGGMFLARRLRGPGLELAWAGTDEVARVRRGDPTVLVRGLPGELLLFLFGRTSVAEVEITGPSVAVDAVRRTSFGM